MNIIVVKIGGSILKDGSDFKRTASKINELVEKGYKVVTVISAMNGTTDDIIASLRGSQEALWKIRQRYLDTIYYLGLEKTKDRIEEELSLLKKVVETNLRADPLLTDLALSRGERMSRIILTDFLFTFNEKTVGIGAENILRGTKTYPVPKIEPWLSLPGLRKIRSMLAYSDILVTEGFIASGPEGNIITLGRGGSDYTATFLASQLNALKLIIFTDVPGIMSGDPNIIPNARTVTELSLKEAFEASRYGVKKLHPRAFEPLVHNRYVETIVRSPESKGSIIRRESHNDGCNPKILSVNDNSLAVIGECKEKHLLLERLLQAAREAGLKVSGLISRPTSPVAELHADRGCLLSPQAASMIHDMVIGG